MIENHVATDERPSATTRPAGVTNLDTPPAFARRRARLGALAFKRARDLPPRGVSSHTRAPSGSSRECAANIDVSGRWGAGGPIVAARSTGRGVSGRRAAP